MGKDLSDRGVVMVVAVEPGSSEETCKISFYRKVSTGIGPDDGPGGAGPRDAPALERIPEDSADAMTHEKWLREKLRARGEVPYPEFVHLHAEDLSEARNREEPHTPLTREQLAQAQAE